MPHSFLRSFIAYCKSLVSKDTAYACTNGVPAMPCAHDLCVFDSSVHIVSIGVEMQVQGRFCKSFLEFCNELSLQFGRQCNVWHAAFTARQRRLAMLTLLLFLPYVIAAAQASTAQHHHKWRQCLLEAVCSACAASFFLVLLSFAVESSASLADTDSSVSSSTSCVIPSQSVLAKTSSNTSRSNDASALPSSS